MGRGATDGPHMPRWSHPYTLHWQAHATQALHPRSQAVRHAQAPTTTISSKLLAVHYLENTWKVMLAVAWLSGLTSTSSSASIAWWRPSE